MNELSSTTEKATKQGGTIAQPVIATSSLTTVAIGGIHLLSYSADVKAMLSALAPIVVGVFVYAIQWALVYWDFKPIEVMSAERALDSSIKQLRIDIDTEKSADRDTSDLEEELKQNLIARSKLHRLAIPKH